jgi:hypothetical protein
LAARIGQLPLDAAHIVSLAAVRGDRRHNKYEHTANR